MTVFRDTTFLAAGPASELNRSARGAHWMGAAILARVVAAGAAVFAAVVAMPLSGTRPPPPNRLRQDSRVSDVDSGGEFRIT
jgi:hypothetical protein